MSSKSSAVVRPENLGELRQIEINPKDGDSSYTRTYEAVQSAVDPNRLIWKIVRNPRAVQGVGITATAGVSGNPLSRGLGNVTGAQAFNIDPQDLDPSEVSEPGELVYHLDLLASMRAELSAALQIRMDAVNAARIKEGKPPLNFHVKLASELTPAEKRENQEYLNEQEKAKEPLIRKLINKEFDINIAQVTDDLEEEDPTTDRYLELQKLKSVFEMAKVYLELTDADFEAKRSQHEATLASTASQVFSDDQVQKLAAIGLTPEQLIQMISSQLDVDTGVDASDQNSAQILETNRATSEYQASSERLDYFRSEYARLRARRSSFGFVSKKRFNAAASAYQQAINELHAIECNGLPQDNLSQLSTERAIEEIHTLTQAEAYGMQGSRFYRFANAYKRAGLLKKTLLMLPFGAAFAVATVATGGVAGVAGAAVVGGLKGGLFGASVSRLSESAVVGQESSARGQELLTAREEDAIGVDSVAELTASQAEFYRRDARRKVVGSTLAGAAIGAALGGGLYKLKQYVAGKSPSGSSAKSGGGVNDPVNQSGNVVPHSDNLPNIAVLDGKPFWYSAEASGIVPKGQGQALASYLHSLGLDNGSDIVGFKNMGAWHTASGNFDMSQRALEAVGAFRQNLGL